MKIVVRPVYFVQTPEDEIPQQFYHWTTEDESFDLEIDKDFVEDKFEFVSLFSHYGSMYNYMPRTYKYDSVNDLITFELLRRDGNTMTKGDAKLIEKMMIESAIEDHSSRAWETEHVECPVGSPCVVSKTKMTGHQMEITRCERSLTDPSCVTHSFEVKFEFLTAY